LLLPTVWTASDGQRRRNLDNARAQWDQFNHAKILVARFPNFTGLVQRDEG